MIRRPPRSTLFPYTTSSDLLLSPSLKGTVMSRACKSDRRPATSPPAAPADDRDATGRFAPGNPGGPGNPYARQVARLRSAMLAAITEDDIQEIVRVLLMKAR